MKVGLKKSNLPDDAIEDKFTEEEQEKVVPREHGDEQNNLTEDTVEEIHVETLLPLPHLITPRMVPVDNADIEGSVFVEAKENRCRRSPIHRSSLFSINMCQA